MPEQTCECGATIIFRTHHRTGNPAPIEPVPSARGNLRILPGGEYEVLAGKRLELATEPLYLNHYATCPVWAKRRKA